MAFILILVIVIGSVMGIGYFVSEIFGEKEEYNNGICPKCGNKLNFFSMDSHGGRGYRCPDCQYYAWITHRWVDKDREN